MYNIEDEPFGAKFSLIMGHDEFERYVRHLSADVVWAIKIKRKW